MALNIEQVAMFDSQEGPQLVIGNALNVDPTVVKFEMDVQGATKPPVDVEEDFEEEVVDENNGKINKCSNHRNLA